MVACMVEFQVGKRSRRTTYRLAIHFANNRQQRFRPRSMLQDVFPLIVELWAFNRHDSRVVCSEIEAKLPQFRGGDPWQPVKLRPFFVEL